ncbi:4-aminobutyrate--2-oxoglutarate transaminase [Bacillus kwashiorkori]|uniref:4-aminobutyrate--2-oxoglutarate transaminase n=1 Tax=Bacillus kwashiorkori TaxID=1522318 RepID=UPI00078098E3|nr:4-aminobutyrate--2-oxoglutarate transaminase [Bacillus kwashiorkori]
MDLTRRTIPGPLGEELLTRKNQAVPRGPFHTLPTFIKEAKGAIVVDVDGNKYIDFAGAIGSLNVGHCPPKVIAALKEQIEQYIHPCFHVMMYEPYIELAEKLNTITPGHFPKKTFFLNSGAEAVENAIKIARKFTKRKAIISFERGFHGRTYMSMSLTSKVKPYKNGFGPFVPETYKLPFPYYYYENRLTKEELDERLLKNFRELFIREVPANEVAAVIMELVQGEGGFVIPSKKFVQGVKEICEENGILFIADEIQTGFARTGKMFASEHFSIEPDLMTMSKSIAAGIPISAVTGRADIMDAPEVGEIGGTYGGSPLGCVAALAVIETIEEQQLVKRAEAIGEKFFTTFKALEDRIKQVGEVRHLGAMCAIEFVQDKESKVPNKQFVQQVMAKAHERGLIIMSAGLYSNIIRLLTPLIIKEEELEKGFAILKETIEEVAGMEK